MATAFSASLTACWACIAGPRVPIILPRDTAAGCRRWAVFLATATIGACVLLAAYWLDVDFKADETVTIMSYATQPLAVAASEYDDTNNHVLHTLLVWVAHQLGGWDRVLLRLPAFLSFCLLLPALWWFTRREYGATAAVFATVFAGTSPFLVSYASNARGYTLLLLFFAAALLCGQQLVRTPKRTVLWAAWAATIALGFYALPLMAYPAAATGAWMLLARWRRCGRDEFGPFVARTAAWSVAALALAAVLYLPVFAAEGVGVPYDTVTGWWRLTMPVTPAAFVEHPFTLWRLWHRAIPAWAQGALIALVVAGAAARGRTCRKTGTLSAGVALAWGLLFPANPQLLGPRFAIWALLVFLILAGVGAAFAFECATARAARWPRIASPSSRCFLECASALLLFCILSRWTVGYISDRMGSRIDMGGDSGVGRVVSSVLYQMRPKDYFSAPCLPRSVVLAVRQLHAVEEEVGTHDSIRLPRNRATSVHQVQSPGAGHAPVPRPGTARNGPPPRRLFFIDMVRRLPGGAGLSLCSNRRAPVPEQVEAEWLHDHELAAAFAEGMVYVWDDMSPESVGAQRQQ